MRQYASPWFAVAWVVTAAIVPQQAIAQRDAPDCARVIAGVDAAHLSGETVTSLRRCPASGPDALSRAWSASTPNDSASLTPLVAATAQLRDGRLQRAAQTTAGSPGRHTLVRLAALQALASYYDPALYPSFAFLTTANVGDPIGRAEPRAAVIGATTLPPSQRREFGDLLARLARSDADPVVRGAALRLRQSIAFRDPANTYIEPGSVRLIAGCGPRVTVRSTADIGLPLRVRVPASGFDRTLDLVAAKNGRPVEHALALPPGEVVLTYGGQQLSTISGRSIPCPPELTP